MDEKQQIKLITPLTRGLPKTGQETIYQIGDDGTFADGWWFGRDNAGNRVRFLEKEIVTGELIIMDLATGLMWPKDGSNGGCNDGNVINWIDAILFCTNLDFGGFVGWRMPNLREILSICSQALSNPSTYPIFTNTLGPAYYQYWSGTTYIDNTALAWVGNLAHGNAGTLAKSSSIRIRPVRRFGK